MNKNYYLTTAISYTNGNPHLGHAYEIILADIIARYNRIIGNNTYFVTGTDEHGQKIANHAKSENLNPIDICNKYSQKFKDLNQQFNSSYDYFIRTSSEIHKQTVAEYIKTLLKNDDIYYGSYIGWYDVKEEIYINDTDAKLRNYENLIKLDQPAYFFRLSKYKNKIIEYIKNNRKFITPKSLQNSILNGLENNELKDLCVSRTSFGGNVKLWGIPFTSDPKHIVYVWFDALLNYVTAGKLKHTWPADLHIIGKDIIWFHAVVWLGILLACQLELPKQILAHGFVNDEHGIKMSKTDGNVTNPFDLLNKFPSDLIRIVLCKNITVGDDISFSEETCTLTHNSDIANTISNLVNRICVLCHKFSNGCVPVNVEDNIVDSEQCEDLISKYIEHMDKFKFGQAYELGLELFKKTNLYITKNKIWEKNDQQLGRIRASLECIYIATHFIEPFAPVLSKRILKTLGHNIININQLNNFNLTDGANISPGFTFTKL